MNTSALIYTFFICQTILLVTGAGSLPDWFYAIAITFSGTYLYLDYKEKEGKRRDKAAADLARLLDQEIDRRVTQHTMRLRDTEYTGKTTRLGTCALHNPTGIPAFRQLEPGVVEIYHLCRNCGEECMKHTIKGIMSD